MRRAFFLLALPLLHLAAPAPPTDIDDLIAAQLVAASAAELDANVDPRARFRHVRGPCGRGVGACVLGHCCSARGTCSLSPWACGPLCQPAYSGRGSPCQGGGVARPPPPASLPVAAGPGAPCGAYIASCPSNTCCTRLGACALAGSGLCAEQRNTTHSTHPVIRRQRLVASHAHVAPDGVDRVAAVVNGRTPGPAVWVDAGDTTVVEYVNALPSPSSLHWHGVRVGEDARGTGVASDGAAGVTQRPVSAAVEGAATAAGGPPVFLYSIAPPDPGTYWWHAHAGVQYVDGVRGALVVRGEGDGRRKADTIVFVADWYRAPAAAFLPKLTGAGNPAGNEPVPSSVTINGVAAGAAACVSAPNATCPPPPPVLRSAPAACSSADPLPLLRFINGGGMAPVAVHFVRPGGVKPHVFVVAADGVPTARTRVTRPLRLAVGQRLDVEVCTPVKEGDSMAASAPAWVVVVMDSSLFDATPSSPSALAVLDFDGSGRAPSMPPIFDASAPGSVPPLPPPGGTALTPPPPRADVTHTLTIESKTDGADAAAMYVNGVSHKPHAVDGAHDEPGDSFPSLLERIAGNPEGVGLPPDPPPPAAASSPDVAPPHDARAGWHIVRVPLGSVVDLIFNNRDANDHPIHVHGAAFWVLDAGGTDAGDYVVGRGGRSSDDSTTTTAIVARDTATVAPRSHARLRLVAAAPGPWYVHCHVVWHEKMGLAFVLLVE